MTKENILYFNEIIYDIAAPIDHSQDKYDSNNQELIYPYGLASDTKYGHVIIENSVRENCNNPVASGVLFDKFSSIQNDYQTISTNHANIQATSDIYGHVKIDDELNTQSTNPVQNKLIKNEIDTINTNIDNINIALGGGDITAAPLKLSSPIEETEKSLNEMLTAGFYIYKPESETKFNGLETTYLNEALIVILNNGNSVIQYVYPTKKPKGQYVFNGYQYVRYIELKEDKTIDRTSVWTIVHKPKNEIKIKTKAHESVDIKIYENSTGFTIKWTQNNNDESYTINTDELYSYETICTFDELPIEGAFIFGNLIAKMDVRISKNKIEMRSTLGKGNKIKNINESFFVPRM